MMFFNRRKKYNGRVAALLPAFGLSIEDGGVFGVLDILDGTWRKGMNEYEAALQIAYTLYGGLLKANEPRANGVIDSISRIQKDWVEKGLVTQELVRGFASVISRCEGKQQSQFTPEMELSSNMPDMTETDPIAMFDAGEFVFVVSKDVRSIGERTLGQEMPLHFPLAMVAVNQTTRRPEFFVGLEAGFTDGLFLCTFDMTGAHGNLGDGEAYRNESAFIGKALEIACSTLNVDKNIVREFSN
jgi:hypothetical protein